MAVIVMVVQIFLGSYIFGSLLHILVFKDVMYEEHNKRMHMLEFFCKRHSLPSDLRQDLADHFTYQFQRTRTSKKASLLDVKLPEALEQGVAEHAYYHLLHTCVTLPNAPFHNVSTPFLRSMAVILQDIYCRPEELIIQMNDRAFQLMFVSRGDVILFDANWKEVQHLGPDSPLVPPIMGEVAFFIGCTQPFHAKVASTGDAQLCVLPREAYLKLMNSFPEQHEIIMRNITLKFGLNMQGNDNEIQVSVPMSLEEEAARPFIRELIKEALWSNNIATLGLMMDAATIGNSEEVLKTVRMGFDINAVNYDRQTALHLMARQGYHTDMEALLNEGADVNARDRWGKTALQEAIHNGHEHAVQLLLKWNSKMYIENGASSLCTAASEGNVNLCTILLENGLDPNVGDYDRRTALHLACAEGHNRVVSLLIWKKADLGLKDRWGVTPLQDAIKARHDLVVELLCKEGVSLDKKASVEYMCEAATNDDVEQLKLLSRCGCDMNECDYDSRTPLMLAAAEGNLCSVHYLLYAGAMVNIADRWGGTALCDAVCDPPPPPPFQSSPVSKRGLPVCVKEMFPAL